MMHNDHAASAIHAAAFGVFCILCIIVAVVFVAAQLNRAPPISDTYGNAQSAITNTSQNLSTTTAVEGEPTLVWLALVVAVVFFCLVMIVGLMLLRSAIGA